MSWSLIPRRRVVYGLVLMLFCDWFGCVDEDVLVNVYVQLFSFVSRSFFSQFLCLNLHPPYLNVARLILQWRLFKVMHFQRTKLNTFRSVSTGRVHIAPLHWCIRWHQHTYSAMWVVEIGMEIKAILSHQLKILKFWHITSSKFWYCSWAFDGKDGSIVQSMYKALKKFCTWNPGNEFLNRIYRGWDPNKK